jgi:DNA processing protein
LFHDVNNRKYICMNSNNSIIKHKLDGITGERLGVLHDAPKQLFYRGVDPGMLLQGPTIAIVGSRKMSTYGKAVTEKLASDLARAGVCVVSGLALGVDSAAHRMALAAHTPTIAVLAGGLDSVHPSSHVGLARSIVEQGGVLVSEYPEGMPPLAHQFIARNRIIAALADAVLVTEAALRSGSLHTAAFALDIGKPVFAVPGPITSQLSAGTNELLKTGALLVTEARDILEALHIQAAPKQQKLFDATDAEQSILDILGTGVSDGTELLAATSLDAASFSQALTMLEIQGSIVALGNNMWRIA